jgi:osmotically inducible lipoprotein OsmB
VCRRTEGFEGKGNNYFSPVAWLFAGRNLILNLELNIMNLSKFSRVSLPAVLLVSALGLGGCAGMTAQEKGTATGAVIGGVAGNVVGGGILGTAAGAAVGGVIGHEVTKQK